MRVLLLFALVGCAHALNLDLYSIISDDGAYKIAALGTEKANFSKTTPLAFPDNQCKNGWNLGDGTKGQTSSVFYVNRTWFFMAEQKCNEHVYNISLFGLFAYAYDYTRLRPLGSLSETFPKHTLEDFNVNWDYTCNIFVNSANEKDGELEYSSLQISDYDTQVRPQKTYTVPVCNEKSAYCWRKVDGFSALDPQTRYPDNWPTGEELNCGDQCVIVNAEELLIDGKPQTPRQLVGRSGRTAEVLYNVTEPITVTAITYMSNLELMVGLGICCEKEASWCFKGCKGHEGEMAVFTWNRHNKKEPFQLQYILGANDKQDSFKTATRLGVALAMQWQAGLEYFHVLWQSKIYQFSIQVDKENVMTSLVSKSTREVNPIPVTWAGPFLGY